MVINSKISTVEDLCSQKPYYRVLLDILIGRDMNKDSNILPSPGEVPMNVCDELMSDEHYLGEFEVKLNDLEVPSSYCVGGVQIRHRPVSNESLAIIAQSILTHGFKGDEMVFLGVLKDMDSEENVYRLWKDATSLEQSRIPFFGDIVSKLNIVSENTGPRIYVIDGAHRTRVLQEYCFPSKIQNLKIKVRLFRRRTPKIYEYIYERDHIQSARAVSDDSVTATAHFLAQDYYTRSEGVGKNATGGSTDIRKRSLGNRDTNDDSTDAILQWLPQLYHKGLGSNKDTGLTRAALPIAEICSLVETTLRLDKVIKTYLKGDGISFWCCNELRHISSNRRLLASLVNGLFADEKTMVETKVQMSVEFILGLRAARKANVKKNTVAEFCRQWHLLLDCAGSVYPLSCSGSFDDMCLDWLSTFESNDGASEEVIVKWKKFSSAPVVVAGGDPSLQIEVSPVLESLGSGNFTERNEEVVFSLIPMPSDLIDDSDTTSGSLTTSTEFGISSAVCSTSRDTDETVFNIDLTEEDIQNVENFLDSGGDRLAQNDTLVRTVCGIVDKAGYCFLPPYYWGNYLLTFSRALLRKSKGQLQSNGLYCIENEEKLQEEIRKYLRMTLAPVFVKHFNVVSEKEVEIVSLELLGSTNSSPRCQYHATHCVGDRLVVLVHLTDGDAVQIIPEKFYGGVCSRISGNDEYELSSGKDDSLMKRYSFLASEVNEWRDNNIPAGDVIVVMRNDMIWKLPSLGGGEENVVMCVEVGKKGDLQRKSRMMHQVNVLFDIHGLDSSKVFESVVIKHPTILLDEVIQDDRLRSFLKKVRATFSGKIKTENDRIAQYFRYQRMVSTYNEETQAVESASMRKRKSIPTDDSEGKASKKKPRIRSLTGLRERIERQVLSLHYFFPFLVSSNQKSPDHGIEIVQRNETSVVPEIEIDYLLPRDVLSRISESWNRATSGDIPCNTNELVVKVGDKRYEYKTCESMQGIPCYLLERGFSGVDTMRWLKSLKEEGFDENCVRDVISLVKDINVCDEETFRMLTLRGVEWLDMAPMNRLVLSFERSVSQVKHTFLVKTKDINTEAAQQEITSSHCLKDSKKVFILVNFEGLHWCVIFLDIVKRETMLYDPLNSSFANTLKEIWQHILKPMMDPNGDKRWRTVPPNGIQQKDSFNCGVFCLAFIESSIGITELPKDATMLRLRYLEKSLQTSDLTYEI